MVSGKTADFVFTTTTSAGEVAEYVYNNWPEGKVTLTIHSVSSNLLNNFCIKIFFWCMPNQTVLV